MVRLPSLRGVIDRRILVNFRIEADALDAVLPNPFEPRTIDGYAIGGICLLRLTDVRPRGLPAFVGTRSENAAHRIGVEWEGEDDSSGRQAGECGRRTGVYVPRRDTSSRLTAAVGRRSFGEYYRADFDVDERDGRYAVRMRSRDGETAMSVTASEADGLPADSVFDSVAAASEYHRRGAVGYSPAPGGGRFDGVELATDEWRVTPLSVDAVSASFFENERRFPAGAVTFDNALLMRDIGHEWRDVGSICPEPEAAANESADVPSTA